MLEPSTPTPSPAPKLPDPAVVLGSNPSEPQRRWAEERARCGRVCDSLDGFERPLVEEQAK